MFPQATDQFIPEADVPAWKTFSALFLRNQITTLAKKFARDNSWDNRGN